MTLDRALALVRGLTESLLATDLSHPERRFVVSVVRGVPEYDVAVTARAIDVAAEIARSPSLTGAADALSDDDRRSVLFIVDSLLDLVDEPKRARGPITARDPQPPARPPA